MRVAARIPNLFGDGRDAEMTYCETPAGARGFAAGAFSLAGSLWDPHRALVASLWDRLARD